MVFLVLGIQPLQADWIPVLREQLDFRILCDWALSCMLALPQNGSNGDHNMNGALRPALPIICSRV